MKTDPYFDYLDKGYSIGFLIYDGSPFYLDGQDTVWIIDERNLINASSGGNRIIFLSSTKFSLSDRTDAERALSRTWHSITGYIYEEAGDYSFINTALHEALADVQATIMLGYPDVFRGVPPDYSPTSMDRALDNTLKLGYDEVGEGHYDGRILSGAHWDLAKLTSLDFMAELMHFTRFAVPNGRTVGQAFY